SRMRPRRTLRSDEAEKAGLAEDLRRREPPRPLPRDFVPSRQEAPGALEQKLVQVPIRPRHRAVAEVALPTRYHPVDLLHHLGPRRDVAGRQNAAHALTQTGHGLSGRSRRQIGPTRWPMHHRTKSVAEEIERLPSRVAQARLPLVHRQFQIRYPPPG